MTQNQNLAPVFLEPVALPGVGVDPERREALQEETTFRKRQRFLFSLSMHKSGRHAYAGTVPSEARARRREKNCVARRSRRANRSRS